ncbi:L,D-transpeptidase, partial [Klebsiella pneumoniae]|nr:L,D-transpeptidase [Klebsiella pneumoniae]
MRNRFPVTLWLTLVALVAALALPARANTCPLPPPGSRLLAHYPFHLVPDHASS